MFSYSYDAGKMEKYGNSIGFAVFVAVMLQKRLDRASEKRIESGHRRIDDSF